MKKLSLIMAMVLIATVGGVYATWTYTGDTIVHTSTSKTAEMTEVLETTEALGAYSVSTNLTGMTIDQKKGTDAATYHQAILAPVYSSGTDYSLVVTYKPSIHVSADVLENGITTYLWFVNDATWTCDDDGLFDESAQAKNVFNLPYNRNNYITINTIDSAEAVSDKSLKWTKGTDGTGATIFTCVIAGQDAKSFEELIGLNKIILDTASINDQFDKTVVKAVLFHVSSKIPSETINQIGG